MTTAQLDRLEAELPVCPRCGRVGKLPAAAAPSVAWRCTGPPIASHKVTRMEMRLFREVPPDE